MKSTILKIMLALGIATSFTAISTEAQACYSRHCYHGKTYAYHCNGYHRYMKRPCCHHISGGHYQGRPVMITCGEAYYVQHCTRGYWHHHKWHKPYCS